MNEVHVRDSLSSPPLSPSQRSHFWEFAAKRSAELGKALLFNPQAAWVCVVLGIVLVSVPVFFEAPLVRAWPWASVALTLVWVGGSYRLSQHPPTAFLGDLLLGVSWSWLAGAIYWGWFRWEPLWHLPIEAIALPIALWGLYRGWGLVGHCFYLGSLLGTAITDGYFYWMDLMPDWRKLMVAPPTEAVAVVHQALDQVQTYQGAIAAIVCGGLLLLLAWLSGRSGHRHHWVFSGTLIGTLLVDSLFAILVKL